MFPIQFALLKFGFGLVFLTWMSIHGASHYKGGREGGRGGERERERMRCWFMLKKAVEGLTTHTAQHTQHITVQHSTVQHSIPYSLSRSYLAHVGTLFHIADQVLRTYTRREGVYRAYIGCLEVCYMVYRAYIRCL